MNIKSQLYCISTVSINQRPLDFEANTRRICQAIDSLAEQKVKSSLSDLILFPELCVSGYGCEDAFHFAHVWQHALACTQNIADYAAKTVPHSVVVVGLPFYFQGSLYNCSAVLANHKILGMIPKTILAGDGVHYETRWFSAFHKRSSAIISVDGNTFPFGLMAFEHRGARFIIENCRDAWGLGRPADALQDTNFDIILNPSASHFAFDKYKTRRNIVIESSRRFGVAFILTNLLGCEAGRLIYDGHMALASNGVLQYEKLSFSYQDFVTATFSIDIDSNRAKRVRLRSSSTSAFHIEQLYYQNQSLSSPSKQIIAIDTSKTKDKSQNGLLARSIHLSSSEDSAWQKPKTATQLGKDYPRKQQFLRAVCLGMFDYLRKSGNRGFVISLSGGVDSASCAVLVQRTLAYAIDELGLSVTLERLGRCDLLSHISSEKKHLPDILTQVMPHFLYTLYQSTKYSTLNTRQAAAHLSAALAAHHAEVDIQAQVDTYVQIGQSVLGRKLDTAKDNLTLQNIQARSRAPLAWLLANATNSILLTTSNLSEVAVGYCTMDGDTAGGLAPLAGVDKSFLREWLVFMEKQGDELLGPIPELSLVNRQEPSAELSPNQFDEVDLMPYDLLDQIISLAIGERKGPDEILQVLAAKTKISRKELDEYIRKFFDLFAKNQWKRERYAPSFHLAEESLDSRGYHRFPILS